MIHGGNMKLEVERIKVMRISRHPSPVQIMMKNNWRMWNI
jgi:hypothetical protein